MYAILSLEKKRNISAKFEVKPCVVCPVETARPIRGQKRQNLEVCPKRVVMLGEPRHGCILQVWGESPKRFVQKFVETSKVWQTDEQTDKNSIGKGPKLQVMGQCKKDITPLLTLKWIEIPSINTQICGICISLYQNRLHLVMSEEILLSALCKKTVKESTPLPTTPYVLTLVSPTDQYVHSYMMIHPTTPFLTCIQAFFTHKVLSLTAISFNQ